MTFFQEVACFQESVWQPPRTLHPEQVAYFRTMLMTHANKPETGTCAVCDLASCPDWRMAYDQLAIAGELMAEPEQWATGLRDEPWSR